MKPQLKPFSAITSEAIWASATHWMLLYPGKPEAEISADTSAAIMRTWVTPDLLVYPFTYDANTGGITPVSWPVLPGEVELEEWRGLEPDEFNPVYYCSDWSMQNRKGQFHSTNYVGRKGMRPSPRIKDSVTVWVWEADR